MSEEIIQVANQTPIEIALQIDEDGFTTSRKLYFWLYENGSHYKKMSFRQYCENPKNRVGGQQRTIKSQLYLPKESQWPQNPNVEKMRENIFLAVNKCLS